MERQRCQSRALLSARNLRSAPEGELRCLPVVDIRSQCCPMVRSEKRYESCLYDMYDIMVVIAQGITSSHSEQRS